ncbi:MAG: DUF1266 domain-containing protein [Actinophytocola sp.]|uniref:DUF1266 domain-containing protein n=1 Tax=Actinophytocola sp. TaxID=1872138 RepID=UPI0013270EE7|nr:DUF1266 domain-containing protein [Actinophytocola sp.]MPZ79323.1 DUF1266 domain-containing protein [Actinophytocola sp.]
MRRSAGNATSRGRTGCGSAAGRRCGTRPHSGSARSRRSPRASRWTTSATSGRCGGCARSSRSGTFGEDAERDARAALPRALRALLGGDAENPGRGMALVEEALRQRTRVGPELWHHALDELATARGLPYGEREGLLALAADIDRAEDRLRQDGILGLDQRVPSLLACHWAEGVHLVRCGLRAGWLTPAHGTEYLDRAGELARKWYGSWFAVVAAQLLPAMLNDDTEEIHWRYPVAQQLQRDPRGLLAMPIREARPGPK